MFRALEIYGGSPLSSHIYIYISIYIYICMDVSMYVCTGRDFRTFG